MRTALCVRRPCPSLAWLQDLIAPEFFQSAESRSEERGARKVNGSFGSIRLGRDFGFNIPLVADLINEPLYTRHAKGVTVE